MNALLSLFCLTAASIAVHADAPASISVTLRTRVQPFKNLDEWKETTTSIDLAPKETAIVICDMWDKHWCPSASRRCGEMAVKMADVVNTARKKGVLIIHAPSDTMTFYKDSPARKRLQDVKKIPMPKPLDLPDPKCPVDDSDGGCDDVPAPKSYKAWSRQHAAIPIDERARRCLRQRP